MINLKSKTLSRWLESTRAEVKKYKYRHHLLKEKKDQRLRPIVISELINIVNGAHDDARLYLRKKELEISLDPINGKNQFDPAAGYPVILDMITLKGYFGEIFTGLVVENFSPFDEKGWKVPAFSFRFHELAFDQLEMWRQTGIQPGVIPGRTGDDCLAFVLDNNDKIIKSLFCEAKCTPNHSASMISKAHEKISQQNIIPIELRRLIQILAEYHDSESSRWKKALYELFFKKPSKGYTRYDLVCYICGQSPIRPAGKKCWIPNDQPHSEYTGGRNLEAVETHLQDVETLIRQVYKKED